MASKTYELIIKSAEEFLLNSGSTDAKKSKNNKEIIKHIKDKISNGDIIINATDGTILSYISFAANSDEASNIVSGGPGKGYWYENTTGIGDKPEEPQKEDITTGKGTTTVNERDLYPLMQLWLETKGYTSKDLSSLKGGGIWGNPDIIGVELVELFGATEIDIASCEVKLSEKHWEQFIFEGISHKRFSNRSWFCYRVNGDSAPLPKSMDYYAERYRIGVVQIILNDIDFLTLKNNPQNAIDYLDNVIEKIPAVYEKVQLKEQKEVIERANIVLTLAF